MTAQPAKLPPPAMPAFAPGMKVSRRDAAALRDWIRDARADLAALVAGAAAWPLEARIVLLLVAVDAGLKLPQDLVSPILESAPEDAYLPMLVGASDGDRVAMILDVVESRRVTVERDVFLLLTAAQLLDGVGPGRFQTALRLACRHDLYEEEKGMVLLAARKSGDADAKRLARLVTSKPGSDAPRIEKEIRRALEEPSIDLLPEDEVSTEWPVTVRRTVAKVGRNDPCPCGSGKKYKKCCEGKDAARLADPSPVPGVTMAEYKTTSAHLMPVEEFAALRPDEMLAADRAKLPTPHLARALRRATAFHRFDAAEHFLDELVKRKDLPEKRTADDYRLDLVSDALITGALDVAERQIARLAKPESLDDVMRFDLMVLRREAGALDLADALAEDGLRGGTGHLELSHSLLQHRPALGILVARGCLDRKHLKDSDVLADEIEKARDRLLLSPFDPGVALFDDAVEVARQEDEREDDLKELVTEKKALAEEREALKKQLRDQAARASELERQIRRKERQEQETRPASSGPQAAPDEDRRRLASKLDELKALLASSNEERAELRRRVAAMAETKPERPATPARDERAEAEPGEEDESIADVRGGVRVPRLSRNVEEALKEHGAAVAKDALTTIADLSTGNFRGVKRLVKARGLLYSARVGIHFRLLFRPSEGILEILELVHRQELEAVIKRYL